jgi:hypothetical protein
LKETTILTKDLMLVVSVRRVNEGEEVMGESYRRGSTMTEVQESSTGLRRIDGEGQETTWVRMERTSRPV